MCNKSLRHFGQAFYWDFVFTVYHDFSAYSRLCLQGDWSNTESISNRVAIWIRRWCTKVQSLFCNPTIKMFYFNSVVARKNKTRIIWNEMIMHIVSQSSGLCSLHVTKWLAISHHSPLPMLHSHDHEPTITFQHDYGLPCWHIMVMTLSSQHRCVCKRKVIIS